MTRDDLWNLLKERELVKGELPPEEILSPWYIRFFLGLSAWAATLFFIYFIMGIMDLWMQEGSYIMITGGAVLAAGFILQYIPGRNLFVSQLSLALTLGGLILMVVAADKLKLPVRLFSGIFMAAGVFLFLTVKDSVLSFFSVITLGISLLFFFLSLGLDSYMALIFFILQASVWSFETSLPLKPGKARILGYGLFFLLTAVLLLEDGALQSVRSLFRGSYFEPAGVRASLWISPLILLPYLYLFFSRVFKDHRVRSLMTSALLTGLFSGIPGLACAAVILILAFSRGNRVLLGISLFSAIICFIQYYYMLDLTLLVKSLWLTGAGIFFLFLREVLKRRGGKDV